MKTTSDACRKTQTILGPFRYRTKSLYKGKGADGPEKPDKSGNKESFSCMKPGEKKAHDNECQTNEPHHDKRQAEKPHGLSDLMQLIYHAFPLTPFCLQEAQPPPPG